MKWIGQSNINDLLKCHSQITKIVPGLNSVIKMAAIRALRMCLQTRYEIYSLVLKPFAHSTYFLYLKPEQSCNIKAAEDFGPRSKFCNPNINVIYFSGLICAKEFGDTFPDLRKATNITCSVYHTSKQVREEL